MGERCGVEIHAGRYEGDTPIVQVKVCNLPIEGVGPCQYVGCGEADDAYEEGVEGLMAIHNGEIESGDHDYQPSEWRHVERHASGDLELEMGHEATPGERVTG